MRSWVITILEMWYLYKRTIHLIMCCVCLNVLCCNYKFADVYMCKCDVYEHMFVHVSLCVWVIDQCECMFSCIVECKLCVCMCVFECMLCIVYVNTCLSVKYCCVRIGDRWEILYTSICPYVTVHALRSIISCIVFAFHLKGKVFS